MQINRQRTVNGEGVAGCFICGRACDEGDVTVLGRQICPICERITIRLTPSHPLYPFWVTLMRGLFEDGDGDAD